MRIENRGCRPLSSSWLAGWLAGAPRSWARTRGAKPRTPRRTDGWVRRVRTESQEPAGCAIWRDAMPCHAMHVCMCA
ncbi:hypothetical protein HETIRDRAFT_410730 [Heterobasidion irregulare TC 32-1]|uniref:Uncharacterized protein n=1 Tax=Heterobasidion irregulare (strain TC 32-1) TaxID=747525 RepID=W4K131_HETIT|nr:uncharacterized protein HETIRDRAFT_410730 [Heterobasidion irregulare TC 32-1]ETW78776.1 hypothetical protein HETIRDRAFT_410730 [Heterobasidion irregulare TC 32-1]